jgi:hypothetical protein
MVINLLLAALIYSIFVTYLNLSQGNSPAVATNCTDSKCAFIANSSSENNPLDTGNPLTNIEYILGIVLCGIWVFSLRVLQYFGKKINIQLDNNLSSSSDFSIKINNLPYGEYNE